MAATTSTNYTEVANLVQGYANAYLPEMLSLVNSGVVKLVTNPDFVGQGSTYVQRFRNYNSGTWNTPTANTDSTIDNITGANETGVIFRRYKDIGIEDFAKLSSGDLNAVQDVARIQAHNAALNIEKEFFTYLLPGLFAASGALRTSYLLDRETAVFDPNLHMPAAINLLGEAQGKFNTIFMHSKVYNGSQIQLLTQPSMDYNLQRQYAEAGMTYAGRYAGMNVILNDRCYTDGSVYHTYLFAPNAMVLAYQKALTFESYRDWRAAAGTDVIRYTLAASVHVPGTTWQGTTPSGMGGVTDAALATVGNWTTRTGLQTSEMGVVCISSLSNL